MAKDDEQEKCPKDGLLPTTHRYSGGVKQLICGNGHNWAEGSGRKSDTAKAADSYEEAKRSMREYFERYATGKW